MSSANIIHLKRSLESAMSLIYIINMIGLKIDLWRTPVVIGATSPTSTYRLGIYCIGSSYRDEVQHHLYYNNLIYVTGCCDRWCQPLSINQGICLLELLTDQVPEQF